MVPSSESAAASVGRPSGQPIPSGSEGCAADTALADGQPVTWRLDHALALLRHSGHGEPDGEPGSPLYLQRLIDQLVSLSSRDVLTGLSNRRGFELALMREADRVARSGESALLLLVDIDHFKRVNDMHGHGVGDEVLRAVAGALGESVRPMDMVARIGGEEFALLLPNCPPAFGPQVAARVRLRVARLVLPLANGGVVGVTVSVGGAFAPPWVRSLPDAWMERADAQLYRAKGEGRDRVCFDLPLLPEVSAQERDMLLGGASQTQDTE